MITITREISLDEFEAWSGAVDTLRTVREHDMIDELDQLVLETIGDSLTETELNDFLWFEDGFIFQSLGISEDDEEEEE